MGKIRLSSKSSDLNYPSLKPTLNLNFAAGKSLDPRITFTRNSTATYVGSDGLIKTAVANEPRFDYDPVTGECLGLLIEEQNTNPYPFSNSWGIGYNSNPDGTFGIIDVTTNYGIAPDGTKTSVGLTLSTSQIRTYQSTIPNPSGANCFSFFAKPIGNQSTIRLVHHTGININIVYNFNTLTSSGTVTYVSSYSHGIIKLSNGWYRVYMVFVAPGSSFWPTLANSGLVEVWGKQLESGSFPTSYIPTTDSTVTRAADSATISGTNFSSWYNTSEGTLLSVGEPISSNISSNTSLNIIPSSSSTRTVSNLLYYPKVIQYATLKSMNANGYSYPSPISTTGLLLNLDAGNTQSYSGSGSTWFDLSGQGNNGTLVGGVSYSSANGGSLVFDGGNDYNDLTDFSLGSQITLSCWIKTSTTSFSQLISRGNTANDRGVYLSINRTAGLLSAGGNNTSGWNSKNISNTTINDNEWHNVVGVYNQSSNNVTGYVDGNVGITETVTFDTDNYTPKNTKLARNQIGDIQWYNGNIAQVSIYNRALTEAEIQQNFNATRGRFGL